jgi:hypothetical protein
VSFTGLGLFDLRPGELDVRRVHGVIDLRENRALFHDGPIVDRLAILVLAEGRDHPGHLSAHVDDLFRLHRPRGSDCDDHVATLHVGGLQQQAGAAAPVDPPRAHPCGGDEDQDEDRKRSHRGKVSRWLGRFRIVPAFTVRRNRATHTLAHRGHSAASCRSCGACVQAGPDRPLRARAESDLSLAIKESEFLFTMNES